MARFPCYNVLILIFTLILLVPRLSRSSAKYDLLSVNFYDKTCPNLLDLVGEIVYNAILNETRIGASLLRLHFHDCFVNGCDGSNLLDDTRTEKGEKTAGPNFKSLRGFEVIDSIKVKVESTCPKTVSCADILAIAAMVSVNQLGGNGWNVELGRRDSLTASQGAANKSLPSPKSNLSVLISMFEAVGLTKQDLVVLSGAHTVGKAQCKNFIDRVNKDSDIDMFFAEYLKLKCQKSDGYLQPLDRTPDDFDNFYYVGVSNQEGLLHSDEELLKGGEECIKSLVMMYSMAEQADAFKRDFGTSMVRMGRISPLTGNTGQISVDDLSEIIVHLM